MWDLIGEDILDIGPLPEWLKKGQKLESRNGEMIAYIAKIEEGKNTRVWLSWTPKPPKGGYRTGHEPQAWTLDGLFAHWRPVED